MVQSQTVELWMKKGKNFDYICTTEAVEGPEEKIFIVLEEEQVVILAELLVDRIGGGLNDEATQNYEG